MLHVHSIDRLARDLQHLQHLIDTLTAKGVTVRFHREGMVFDGAATGINKLMLQMLGAFAEFERDRIRERQREGIAKAKERGVYKGRKPSVCKPPQVSAIQK